ncbi:MAG: hypothetical protein HYV52_01685 [Parcubacteria group bacterium]|nr:hypothetical protein [Parcubacteria group bacterium]
MTDVNLVEFEFDNCRICGKITPYKKDDHIDKRMGYVEGGGQLCGECWNKIYSI